MENYNPWKDSITTLRNNVARAIRSFLASKTVINSHWHILFEDWNMSSQEFFGAVEAAVEKRNLPNVKMSRLDFNEGGIFSARREYLRIQRKDFAFDIGAAPFGNAFFISYWLGEVLVGFFAFIAFIPLLGPLLLWMFRRITYFRVDTGAMFRDSVHMAVLEVIDEMTESKGLRKLSEFERKPIMKDIFKK